MNIYWPGTSIVKSKNNVFDWKNRESQIAAQKDFIASNTSRMHRAGAHSSGQAKILTIKDKK